MSRYATHLNNGKSGPEGLTRLMGKLLSGSGVLSATDLAVTAQGTPDMTVKVAPGDAAIYAGAIVYHGWSTANENVTIQSNVSGSSKTDSIVAYIDPTLASTTENNPDSFVFVAVRGASSVPTGTEITTAIGSKPYTVLANVTVGNGVTSINSGNMVDQRVVTVISGDKIAGGGAWTTYTPVLTNASGSASLGNGSSSGRFTKIGRTVTVYVTVGFGTTTSHGGGGAIRISLPVLPANLQNLGFARIYDSGNPHYFGWAINYSGNQWVDFWANGSSFNVTPTAPFTFGDGDGIAFSLTYEAAT